MIGIEQGDNLIEQTVIFAGGQTAAILANCSPRRRKWLSGTSRLRM